MSPLPLSHSLQMSPLPIRSPKHCAKRELKVSKLHKKIFYFVSTFSLTILSLVFLVWTIFHPSKPEFSLREADIYYNNNNNINVSSTHNFNSSIQLTLLSKNPNKRVGIYYDNLKVCASYKGESIANDTSLSPFYQGHEEMNILSTYLVRVGPPVGPTEGEMVLSVRGDGRLRWNVATWVSNSYKIKVQCVATMKLEPMFGSLSLEQETKCSTLV